MPVSHYHRRRWDEPRVTVTVPHDERPCCGDVEARRRNGEQWEVYVRCTDEAETSPEECSGWFAWGDVDGIEIEDVSALAPQRR